MATPTSPNEETPAQQSRFEEHDKEVVIINATEQTTPTTTVTVAPKPMEKYVLSQIKCPICYQYAFKGQLPTCSNGHLVGEKCKAKMENCPLCRQPLNSWGLYLEKIRTPLVETTVTCTGICQGKLTYSNQSSKRAGSLFSRHCCKRLTVQSNEVHHLTFNHYFCDPWYWTSEFPSLPQMPEDSPST
jgi:hypothetical protein